MLKKSDFGQTWGPKCGKSGLLQKIGPGLELGLAFLGVKMSTFDGPDDVQGWESDRIVFWDKVYIVIGPQSVKKWTFFKC